MHRYTRPLGHTYFCLFVFAHRGLFYMQDRMSSGGPLPWAAKEGLDVSRQHVIYRILHLAYCILYLIWYISYITCYLLDTIPYILSTMHFIFHIGYTLHDIYCILHIMYFMLCITYYLLYTIYHMLCLVSFILYIYILDIVYHTRMCQSLVKHAEVERKIQQNFHNNTLTTYTCDGNCVSTAILE